MKAQEALQLFKEADNKNAGAEFAKLLGLWASDNGFFSIWLVVFDAYPLVKKEIITAFKGTAFNSFDNESNPIKRSLEL